ncbi:MAG: YjjG family noncanonical pyrimidine nucleotidase [Prevotellaceae bacterium]|jgi:putative hydrolase of the HAD superfamily|nr:YjjG family noncanonical pyrimidine nucleotidase [Prevotellaceae bacterium]
MFQLFTKKYQHVFFDLDRTLWDFEKNSEQTLREMYEQYSLLSLQFVDIQEFIRIYKRINELMWSEYHRGNITKEQLRHQRFYQTLKAKNIDNSDLADKLDAQYISESPKKTVLMPQARETLEYLKQKNYHLHIITNGFNEVQFVKLRSCAIDNFFDSVTTSEAACSQKPNARIFEYAMQPLHTQKSSCIMVGDDWENDIVGAKNFGCAQVFYNPERKKAGTFTPTKEVKNLAELKSFL